MNGRIHAVVLSTLLTGCLVALLIPLLDISARDQSFFVGIPLLVCWSVGYGPEIYRWARQIMDKHRVKLDSDHDFSWERCLTSSAELVQFCRANFLQTIEKIHGDFDKTNEDQQRFQTVVADITESSIRIANSVLAQLATGHPDTAMAICRQLFELSVNIQIIALDSTMKRARRYQDFDNADMLRREIAIAELLNMDGNQDVLEEMQSQLKQYQELYPGDSLDNNHWALVTPQDRGKRTS